MALRAASVVLCDFGFNGEPWRRGRYIDYVTG